MHLPFVCIVSMPSPPVLLHINLLIEDDDDEEENK